MDRDDQSKHNSDYFHEHTYADKREAEQMERKISSFKRNRRRHSSFDSKEAREAKGDEDDVADEDESDGEVSNKNRRDNRDEESDIENVKRGAGKHRIRKGSGKFEGEPQEYQDDYKSGEEHPEWRSNWRPWLRAKAIRSDGGSSDRSSDKYIDNEGADDEQPEKRRIHKSRKSRNDNDDDQQENNDDDSSER